MALTCRCTPGGGQEVVRLVPDAGAIEAFGPDITDLTAWVPAYQAGVRYGYTHEVAQREAPDSRIVYVDNDPIVLRHAQALLTSSPEGACDYIQADLRDPETIVAEAARTLDFGSPVALMLLAVLQFALDKQDPYELVSRLIAVLPSGSYLVLSHPTDDFNPNKGESMRVYNERSVEQAVVRDKTETARFFDGLDLLDPGVVPVAGWRPDSDATAAKDLCTYVIGSGALLTCSPRLLALQLSLLALDAALPTRRSGAKYRDPTVPTILTRAPDAGPVTAVPAYEQVVENKKLTTMGSGAILAGVTDPWAPPDAPRARAEREYTALFRIQQRHADTPARRDRGRHPAMIGPGEAVRLLVGLAAGSAVAEDGEDAVDAADLTAALTLMPMVRAEIDQLEASLLLIARGQGMTWQGLAFWLGLGSAQAARQRYERLNLKVAPAGPHDDVLRRRLLTAGTGG